MPGFCTVDDVRRVMQESELNFGNDELSEDNYAPVVNEIESTSETIEKATKRYWYAPDPIDGDEQGAVATSPKTRDDEESIPTGGAHLVGEPVTPKTWQGSYTRIVFGRKDAESVSELLVRTPDGYEDWTEEYQGGTWPDALGDDYYIRVNNGGVSQLYLDSENLLDEDGEPLIESFANAVYVSFSYGHEGLPQRIRRGTAYLVAFALVDDELVAQVPDNARYMDMDTKAERWGRLGIGKLEDDIEDRGPLEPYT